MSFLDSVKSELGDAIKLYGDYEAIRSGSNVGSTTTQETVKPQQATGTKVEYPATIMGMPRTAVIVGGVGVAALVVFMLVRK